MGTRHAPDERRPLTDHELENLDPHDLLRIKLSSDEISRLREINAAREKDRLQRVASLKVEEAPIVAELRLAGLMVNSVADLVSRREPYPSAIPILLKHVRQSYSDPLKSTVARALAIPEPEVRKAWPTLVHEYRRAATDDGGAGRPEIKPPMRQAAQGLACVLAVAVTDETLDELIGLVKDKRLGESRILLLSGLRNSTAPRAVAAIAEASEDPVLHKEIASWRQFTGQRRPKRRDN